MVPSSLAVITATFRADHQGQAIGYWASLTAIAVALGPLVGGILVDLASWRWVFLINLPIGLATAAAALRYVPETRDAEARGRLDVLGGALAVLALAGLTYAPVEGPERGWTNPLVLITLLGGLALLAAFFLVEARARNPMLPLHFFRARQFTAANAATVGLYCAIESFFFLSVIHLQRQIGFSAVVAGTALVPITVLLVLLSPTAGKVANRIGARLPMTVGPLLAAGGAMLLSRVGPDTAEPTAASYFSDVFPPFVIFGLGLAVTVAPLTTAALTALDDRHAGLASGVNTAVARVAGLLGIALLPLVAGIAEAGDLESAGFAEGFRLAMWICAGLCVASATLAFLLVPADAGKAGPDEAEVAVVSAAAAVEGQSGTAPSEPSGSISS
jgi:MFS family permease